jgi:hypothetical protein
MFKKSITQKAGNADTRSAEYAQQPARHTRLLCRIAALVAAAGISGTVALSSAGAASAAVTPVVTSEPLFDCYSGSIVADKPSIVENGGTITWQPEVVYYTNGQWAHAAWGPQQTVPATSR